jgi:hypothetical protein
MTGMNVVILVVAAAIWIAWGVYLMLGVNDYGIRRFRRGRLFLVALISGPGFWVAMAVIFASKWMMEWARDW